MDSRQFCSVCKQWLDMEVVPTADGDDDGVVWFRCPQCQGFLPKLSSALAGSTAGADAPDVAADAEPDGAAPTGDAGEGGGSREKKSPRRAAADDAKGGGRRARRPVADAEGDDDAHAADDDDRDDADDADDLDDRLDDDDEAAEELSAPGAAASAATAEPVMEYAAQLAAADPGNAVPYRPWETYEVGQCVLHLAWNDCGIVVAKEALPGGRRIIKCWFQGAGVVRLIENAPR